MLRVPLALNWIKRDLRPLYANTQATPKQVFLDPAWDFSVDIVPGMALMQTAGNNVLPVTTGGLVAGLAAFFEAPLLGIREITDQGINSTAMWVMSPDAEFEIANLTGTAKAFDDSLTYSDPSTGTKTKISAYLTGSKRGQLCPEGTSGASAAFARLIAVNSSSKITIGGLSGTV